MLRLRTLAVLVLVTGCSPAPMPGVDAGSDGGIDAGVDAGVPKAGDACPARGFGACSPDAGDLLICDDAGWKTLSDCRTSTPAGCRQESGSVRCGCGPLDSACHQDAGEQSCGGGYCKADEYCKPGGISDCALRDGGPPCISTRDGGGCIGDFDCEVGCSCSANACHR